MVQRVFVHPGPPKTGTTYLQTLLYANVDSLRRQGVLMAGSQRANFNAANDLRETRSRRGKTVPKGAWDRMCGLVREYDGDAVMSCERYSLLHAPHVQRIVDELDEREVHVVLTLRDVAAVLPASWQEALKNGSSTTWADFCDRLTTDPAALRRVSRAHFALRVWSGVLPPDRVHVVTVPPPTAPRTLLLERFCEVVGVDPDRLAVQEAPRANTSLDLVGAEVVRRLNASADVDLSPQTHHSEIKKFLTAQVLATKRRADRPRLTGAAFAAARAESEQLYGRIEADGLKVVGDLADLTCTPVPDDDASAEPDKDAVIDAAVEAIGALADRSAQRGLQIRSLRRAARQRRAASSKPRRWRSSWPLRRGR